MADLKQLGVTCSRCGCIGAWRRSEASANLHLLIVDRVVPLIKGSADAIGNKRPLCEEPCHCEVTTEQFGQAVTAQRRGVGHDGQPISVEHPWNRQG